MNIKRITIISLLLFSALTLSGCCGLHHGKHGCCKAGGQASCAQPGSCDQAECNKPCCQKMKTATPAQ